MALHWAFHDPAGNRQLGLNGGSMGMYWLYAGFWREGVTWLTTALDDPADATVIQVAGRIWRWGCCCWRKENFAPLKRRWRWRSNCWKTAQTGGHWRWHA